MTKPKRRGRPPKKKVEEDFKKMNIPAGLGMEEPMPVEIKSKKRRVVEEQLADANPVLNRIREILTTFDSRVGDLFLEKKSLTKTDMNALTHIKNELANNLETISAIAREKKPKDAVFRINQEKWAIRMGFSYPDENGITYSRNVGEPVPRNMLQSDAERLFREGYLWNVKPDGSYAAYEGLQDMDENMLMMFMKKTDKDLIHRIKTQPFTIDTLINMERIAVDMKYSKFVIDAIKEKMKEIETR